MLSSAISVGRRSFPVGNWVNWLLVIGGIVCVIIELALGALTGFDLALVGGSLAVGWRHRPFCWLGKDWSVVWWRPGIYLLGDLPAFASREAHRERPCLQCRRHCRQNRHRHSENRRHGSRNGKGRPRDLAG